MNAKNEAMEWLDSGNDNIYDAEEIIENLLKELEEKDKAILEAVSLIDARNKQLEAAEKEIEVLRNHGNKDCTAMADEALKD